MCSNIVAFSSCLTYLWCATPKHPVLSVMPRRPKIMNKNVLESVVGKKMSSNAEYKYAIHFRNFLFEAVF